MIGGNITVQLQVQSHTTNEIGSRVPVWHDVMNLKGFLDMSGETTNRTTFNAKIQESTHVFICDYMPIPDTVEIEGSLIEVTTENVRIVAQGKPYEVTMIDNPMNLNKHLEIFLKFTGGQ